MVTRTNKPEEGAPGAPNDQGGDHVESLDQIAKLGTELDVPKVDAKEVTDAENKAAMEISSALSLLREAAVPFAPEHTHNPLNQIWSDKQLDQIAACIVELCKYHGVPVGEFFVNFGPYLQLFFVLGLPAVATIKIIKSKPPQVANGQQQQA